MLYVATPVDLPLRHSADIRVEPVDDVRGAVRQWFSMPHVRFVGAHTGCSCGFPSIIADVPLEWFEGMPIDSDDRPGDLRSIAALLDLLREATSDHRTVELYPTADGRETFPPRGTIQWFIDDIHPDRFFFNEQYLYRVTSRSDPA